MLDFVYFPKHALMGLLHAGATKHWFDRAINSWVTQLEASSSPAVSSL